MLRIYFVCSLKCTKQISFQVTASLAFCPGQADAPDGPGKKLDHAQSVTHFSLSFY